MPRSIAEWMKGQLSVALDGRPNKAELRALLSLLGEEGEDPREAYNQAVLQRKQAFPEWPPAPNYDEL